MLMVKRKTLIILMVLVVLLGSLSSVSYGESFAYESTIRVGLRYYYEEVPSITIYNRSLLLGYEVDNAYIIEHEATSTGNFVLSPATNYFLISTNTYATFDEANIQVNIIREQGFNAYCGSVSQGNWKVYVGNVDNSEVLTNIYTIINGINDITYEMVADNGLRTILTFDGNYPIIFENSYDHIQFYTNDTRNGVPITDLGTRSYRGRVEIGRYNNAGVSAVNIVDIESYLYGVIPSEMPVEWQLEALKAQAVAARNYAVYHTAVNPKYISRPYPIDDTIRSQVYKGYAIEELKSNQAVDETQGILIYYNDEVIPSYFFSTSGGHTESSSNVWTGNVAYLQGVPDIYETNPFKEPWTSEWTGAEFVQELTSNGVFIGELLSIDLQYIDTGRVYSMTFNGTEGNYTVEKETIRYWFDFYSRKFKMIENGYVPNTLIRATGSDGVIDTVDLSSSYVIDGNMDITQVDISNDQIQLISSTNIDNMPLVYGDNGKYIIVGQGYGHGVGMSQSGARGMADEGFTFKEILEYYYTGVSVY